MYEIEPAKTHTKRARRSGIKLPLAMMEVDQSIFIPEEDVTSRSILDMRAYRVGARLKRRFSVGKVDGGFRIWRIE